MPRHATGTVVHRDATAAEPAERWGKCTDAAGERTPWMRLGTWPNSPQGRARAGETCAALSERLETTQRYIRLAETLGKGFGTPFPELPEGLLRDGDLAEFFGTRAG